MAQEFVELFRNRTRKPHRFPGPRMGELPPGRMQKFSWQKDCRARLAANFRGRAVEAVPSHGMPQRRKMNANLVGASGFDPDFEQTEFAVRGVDPPLDFIMSDRLPS